MRTYLRRAAISICIALFSVFLCAPPATAQSNGTSGSVTGTGSDPTGVVLRAALNGQPAVSLVDNNIPPTADPVFGAPIALPLTADEEFQYGLSCAGDKATPTHQIGTPVMLAGVTYYECQANQLTSSLLNIPPPNQGNNDHEPPRVAPRSLFDMTLGEDNLFHGDKYKWGAQVTAINVTDKYALYNFLSTFSGTHYVTPRAITGQISLSF